MRGYMTDQSNLTNEKIRILWQSNSPWANTGYGVQTKLFAPRIDQLGYKTAIFAYYGLQGGMLHINGVPIYPGFFEAYGNDVMSAHAMNWRADVLMTLTDTWILETGMIPQGLKWIPYYPIDHVTLPDTIKRNLSTAYRKIAMSKFGQKVVQEAGLHSYYVPHAIDTEVFKPMDKYEAREKLGWPKDAYIMGMVAMNKGNPSRKSFVEILTAFRDFKKTHNDAFFYCHTGLSLQGEAHGINMHALCNTLGLVPGKDVMFPDQYHLFLGIPDTMMSAMYSALDVHVLVSKGEGFGIPLLEAQACGCPVITGGWTAMDELCFSGQKIDKSDADPEYTGLNAFQMKPRIRPIELAMHAEYLKPSSRLRAAEKAKEYDVNIVMEKYWKPVLEEINASVLGDKEQLMKEYQAAVEKAAK